MKIISVQILRGLASILVLLAHAQMPFNQPHHATLLFLFEPGTSGVTLFFILSGFIICYANINKQFSAKDFLISRFNRIYPTYWACSLLFIFLFLLENYLFKNSAYEFSQYGFKDWVKSFTLVPFSKIGNQWPFIPVAWSLSYEILFYIIFGFIVYFKNRYINYLLVLYITFIFYCSLNLSSIHLGFPLNFIFNSDILCFVLGVFVYFLLQLKIGEKKQGSIAIFFLLSGLLYLAFIWNYELLGMEALKQIPRFYLLGPPYAFILYGAILFEKANKEGMLNFPMKSIFMYLGNASYSIYLFHYLTLTILLPILKPLERYIGTYLLFIFLCILTLSICLGGYQFIERPLLLWLRRKA
jgi:peptidoglycan/LPS O-acetylase OafA/YrhL